jgi:RNase P/RNase MRP subunit p29
MFTGLLIGRIATIVESTDPSLMMRRGLILDETKNTLLIQEVQSMKNITIPKSIVRLALEPLGNSQAQMLKGTELLASPEERIKS